MPVSRRAGGQGLQALQASAPWSTHPNRRIDPPMRPPTPLKSITRQCVLMHMHTCMHARTQTHTRTHANTHTHAPVEPEVYSRNSGCSAGTHSTGHTAGWASISACHHLSRPRVKGVSAWGMAASFAYTSTLSTCNCHGCWNCNGGVFHLSSSPSSH